ncbi:MAG: NAD-dependent epimerase/dehydratase family protein [Bacteroidetes bacterium]|jgi:UDP-2-acetamido-2,6-beta-L-arabino-hexul-4-ose reductase|nr:NAD-dependent epimerase/dehydratase family protein [Bacteroidota bacterium]
MIKVGITGGNGFIGTHLSNWLRLWPDRFELVPFERAWFDQPQKLAAFTAQCDCVVHLAALNRHNDADTIYETNIRLVKQLVEALESSGSEAKVIFSSSTQEERENAYGRSKQEGRRYLSEWAEGSEGSFSGLVIPNVFGPFGDPYYNSVVATFSHQLTHNETPEIITDATLELIYIDELVQQMIHHIEDQSDNSYNRVQIDPPSKSTVSELLKTLQRFCEDYVDRGIFPAMRNSFDIQLFNTFRSYINHEEHFPVNLELHEDERGRFAETVHLKTGGQVSFSTTAPGVTRGNHFHTRKIERFAVIRGQARIEMRRVDSNEVLSFELSGESPGYVDMPVWYTHNITNSGDDDLYTLFWINEIYDPEDADTYYMDV